MTEREELARVIITAYNEPEDGCPCEQDYEVADAILAAGYRKVEIVSEEFLDSLPDEAPGLLAAVKEVRQRLTRD